MKIFLSNFFNLIRLNNYSKNFVIFVPIFTTQSFSRDYIFHSIYIFICFSIFATIIYIFNDLHDLPNDKKHKEKKKRALASGKVSKFFAKLIIFSFLIIGLIILYNLKDKNLYVFFIFYVTLNIFYTKYLKKIIYIDVICLAFFMTSRGLAGNIAIDFHASWWLILFLFLMFSSLAFAKRYSEIVFFNKQKIIGRPYSFKHKEKIKLLFVFFSSLSIISITYYFNFIIDNTIYKQPNLLNLVTLVYFGWIYWLNYNIENRKLKTDPVLFAIRDRVSYFLSICVLIILYISSNS